MITLTLLHNIKLFIASQKKLLLRAFLDAKSSRRVLRSIVYNIALLNVHMAKPFTFLMA
jgi:hypothetical protein